MAEVVLVLGEPRSIPLDQTLPDSSARNVFPGEIVEVLHLGAHLNNGNESDGRVRVGILVDDFSSPLTAEITGASAARMGLDEGQSIYATFKATEARAYM